jgi:hypothetical protein
MVGLPAIDVSGASSGVAARSQRLVDNQLAERIPLRHVQMFVTGSKASAALLLATVSACGSSSNFN